LKNAQILTLNTGSSSLKAALFSSVDGIARTFSVDVKGIGAGHSKLSVTDADGNRRDVVAALPDQHSALEQTFSALARHVDIHELQIVGHRVVHGGAEFFAPVLITAETLAALRRLVELAPDHLPQALDSIDYVAKSYPQLKQMACFDTEFHQTMPWVAKSYALPARFYKAGIRRYGFHGLSYAYIMQALNSLEPALARGKVVIAHLGSGASMAAVEDGASVDTSMGFTPESGLVMSTRPGTIDAGAVLRMFTAMGLGAAEIDSLINHKSGLLGISEASSDMQTLLNMQSSDPKAAAAIDMFCHRANAQLGAYCATLGGLDVLVFTGGIGENAPEIRRRICERLEFIGLVIDDVANAAGQAVISRGNSRVRVRVIETDEDLMIAQHAQKFIISREP
jgi:acetate kinase